MDDPRLAEIATARKLANLITTSLDVVGVAAVAGGVGAGLWPRLGWYALAVSGLVLWAASWWITTAPHPVAWLRDRRLRLRLWMQRHRAARRARREARARAPAVPQFGLPSPPFPPLPDGLVRLLSGRR